MASPDIVVSPVDGKADLKAFIDLPKRLYAGHKGYIAHLNVERQEAFSPEQEPAVRPCRGAVLPGAPRRPGGRPHHRPDRPCLSRALCRRHRPFRLPGGGGRSGDLRRPVRRRRGLAARQGHEAGDRPVQPVGQRGGRPAGLGLRQPLGAAGALRSALCRRARRRLRLRQDQGRLLLRLRRPERARDDRRQADGAGRHGRAGSRCAPPT